MEISKIKTNISEFNGQNIFQPKSPKNEKIINPLSSSVSNFVSKGINFDNFDSQNIFKIPLNSSLNKQFSSPLNTKNSNMNGINNSKIKENDIRRYKSQKTKDFLKNMDKEGKKKLGVINEIVLDDQNEKVVSNNPKKRFFINNEKKWKNNKEKKKLNIIEELRDFDRKQQINLEKYINDIKKRNFEKMYKKTLKTNYEELNPSYNIECICLDANNKINNGTLKEEESSNLDERINENSSEKEIEINYNINKQNLFSNTAIKKDLDDFEKMKQKYFQKTIFSPTYSNSEYKVKYLNNYLKKDSLVKNLFDHYNDKNGQISENKKRVLNLFNNNRNIFQNNIIDLNNINHTSRENDSIFKTPNYKNDEDKIKIKYNNINEMNSPQFIFKNKLELNTAQEKNRDTGLNLNNRYNNINNNMSQESINNYNNRDSIKSIMHSNSYYKKIMTSKDDDIEKKYNNILNSINEKLYKNKLKKKVSEIENNNIIRAFSLEKSSNNNIFSNENLSYNISKNKAHEFINLKLTRHFFYRNSNPHRINYL